MIDRYGWCSRSHQQQTKFLEFVAYFLLPPIFSRFKCSFFLFNFECLPIAVFSALFHSCLAVRKPGKKKDWEKNPKLEFKIPTYKSTGILFSELVLRVRIIPPRGHLPPIVTQNKIPKPHNTTLQNSVFKIDSPSPNYSSPWTSATSCNSTSRSHPLRGFLEGSSLAHHPVEGELF